MTCPSSKLLRSPGPKPMPPDRVRSEPVVAMLTPAEARQVRLGATGDGVSVSDWVRAAVLARLGKAEP